MTQDVIKLKYDSKFLDRWPIVGSHIKRIGFVRTIVGGDSMYLSIPMFIIFHVISIEFLLQRVLTPLLGLEKINPRDYIILDRHKIKGLPWFDRFNCIFCGYANGLAVLLNEKLNQIIEKEGNPGLIRKGIILIVVAILSPIIIAVQFISIEIIYNILVSRPLGMKRTDPHNLKKQLEKNNFGINYGKLAKFYLVNQKIFSMRMLSALEQIESSWCPLKHFEKRKGIIYPEHHKNFFEPHEIENMRKVLQTKGTVSDFEPYW